MVKDFELPYDAGKYKSWFSLLDFSDLLDSVVPARQVVAALNSLADVHS